jgi:SAM-dependent methyltransferase
MEPDEIQRRIAAFPRWMYRFEFDNGVSTQVPDRGMVNRQEQRRRYFFEPLIGLAGGSLAGRRVLDLGCNAGFWSLEAIEAGADFVLGVDAQRDSVEQAKLVFEAKDIDPARYRFEPGDIFEHDFREPFDVVLCLGLMEHIAKPLELFELIAGVGAQIVVVDTEVSRSRASLFEVDWSRSGPDTQIVLIPSRAALMELAGQYGFATVPLGHEISDFAGMGDYKHQRRLAFVCAKDASLGTLPIERRTPILPWWLTAWRPRRRSLAG